jgi:adenine-specific DNA-methyltransferase
MEKLKMHSRDLTQGNIAKLAELFPTCVTESKNEQGKLQYIIDFDLLRQELTGSIVEGSQERYHLNWPGKRESLLNANSPISNTLRPCRKESVNFETTKNIFIEGDNLEALKLIQETYLHKIKMIYIDPPYNTGNDFLYEDDFSENSEEFYKKSNQRDDLSNRLVANPTSNGRFHSDWLSMMYSRLKLTRNILCDSGVIFISIDDNELTNLIKLCAEIFGEENYIGLLSVENNPKGRKNSRFISVSNDYCLVFAKDKSQSVFIENIPKNIDDLEEDEEGNLVHKSGKRVLVGENSFNNLVSDQESEKHYSVYFNASQKDMVFRTEHDSEYGDEVLLDKGYRRYISSRDGKFIENTYTKSKLQELHKKNALEFKESKIFEKNLRSSIRVKSMITNRDYNAVINGEKVKYKIDVKTTSAGSILKEMFSTKESIFPAPKNPGLIKILATLFEDKSFTVLDFFAGSSTTAHAIMQLNSEDGGDRKFIMVQLPEDCDESSDAFKSGYKNIAELSRERIRRAGKSLLENRCHKDWNRDIGFRVFKIESSNMSDVFYHPDSINQKDLDLLVDNIKVDRTSEDLLFQVLLDWGVDLTLPINQELCSGKTIFFVDGNALAACFDKDIADDVIKTIAAKKPLRAVFRDAGFSSDSSKINLEQIFKLLSPSTELRCI